MTSSVACAMLRSSDFPSFGHITSRRTHDCALASEASEAHISSTFDAFQQRLTCGTGARGHWGRGRPWPRRTAQRAAGPALPPQAHQERRQTAAPPIALPQARQGHGGAVDLRQDAPGSQHSFVSGDWSAFCGFAAAALCSVSCSGRVHRIAVFAATTSFSIFVQFRSSLLLAASTALPTPCAFFSDAFEKHLVSKRYVALVAGELEGCGCITTPLDGKVRRTNIHHNQ